MCAHSYLSIYLFIYSFIYTSYILNRCIYTYMSYVYICVCVILCHDLTWWYVNLIYDMVVQPKTGINPMANPHLLYNGLLSPNSDIRLFPSPHILVLSCLDIHLTCLVVSYPIRIGSSHLVWSNFSIALSTESSSPLHDPVALYEKTCKSIVRKCCRRQILCSVVLVCLCGAKQCEVPETPSAMDLARLSHTNCLLP